MNIYFDTEFTGLHKNTSLISIGLVSDTGDKLYLEFSDYDRYQCDDWIKTNVINNLFSGLDIEEFTKNPNNIYNYADTETNKQILYNWLKSYNTDIQLISDVCHYDMVLFIDIFGTALDLPKFINASCHDINQDIASYFNISELEAFNKSREELIDKLGIHTADTYNKHNALYDAEVIKNIYTYINKN